LSNPEPSEFGSHLANLYAMDEHNGWSQGMRWITLAFLAGMPIIKGPYLDLGCGGGMFVHELAAVRPQSLVLGADLSSTALMYAQDRSSSERLLQADVGRLPLAAGSIGLITALDAFDQMGVEIERTLDEAQRVLRPGGLLLLRVSAHPWLWGPHDVAYNTGRRWHAHDLLACLQAAGFTVERTTYANALLSPAVVAMRLLQRWGWLGVDAADEDSGPLNDLMRRALAAEAQWLVYHKFPFGISFYALARKPRATDRPERP
jgi:ubiquinone/menaquinone biosynthesis C-methylase UbiE